MKNNGTICAFLCNARRGYHNARTIEKIFKLVRVFVLFIIFIVLVIIFIVIPISIAIAKYYQSEAPECLSGITTAEISNYALVESWSDSFKQIGWTPMGHGNYAYFLTPTEYVGKPIDELGLHLPVNFKSLGAPTPGFSENGFIAVAIGNIDSDERLDVWWIDQNRMPRNLQDDVNHWEIIWSHMKENEYISRFFSD